MYETIKTRITAKLTDSAPKVLLYLDIDVSNARLNMEMHKYDLADFWINILSGYLDCMEAQGVITAEESHGLISELRGIGT